MSEEQPTSDQPAEEPQPQEESQDQQAAEDAPTDAALEPYLGVEEYLLVAPGLRTMTPAVRKAAEAAFKRWMQTSGHDVYGHMPLAQWQEHYDMAMAHS